MRFSIYNAPFCFLAHPHCTNDTEYNASYFVLLIFPCTITVVFYWSNLEIREV